MRMEGFTPKLLTRSDKKWLLVMDNLVDYETVATIWPTTSRNGGAIIVTTQKPGNLCPWADSEIVLHPLSAEEGSEMLLSQVESKTGTPSLSGDKTELAKEISDSVCGLPLWISHISGFILQSQCTLSECLEIYRSSNAFLDKSERIWMYERTSGAVFDLAFSKLTEDAKNLLYILAFLNPDGMPESMFSLDSLDNSLGFLDIKKRHRWVL